MQPTLTLLHGVEPDEFGVHHGLEMAQALLAHAFPFIAPYAHGDADVARKLYTILAVRTLADLLADADAEGGLPWAMATIHKPGPKRTALCEGHLAASEHDVLRLLQQADAMEAMTISDEDFDPEDSGP